MLRVVVVGSSGSGKTTLARGVAEHLDLPHLELDSVAHRGGFNRTPAEQFRAEIDAFTRASRWVVDGNYASWGMQEVAWPRADTFVWLDLPRRTVMRRVVGRTLRRVVTRERLWGGVREPWTNLYSLDPEDNIVVWAWTRFYSIRSRYEAAVHTAWSHATVHRLRAPSQVRAFVTGLPPQSSRHPAENGRSP